MEKEKAANKSIDLDKEKEQNSTEDVVSRGDNLKPW